jgi:hypothetical protein
MNRTPTEFRIVYNEWKKTAPANDSDIIPDKPKESETPRHAGLSGELKPLLDWRARYESTDPLQTNYLQAGEFDVITTDTGKESVKLDSEGNLKEQSAAEIIRAVEDVVFKKSFDNVVCYTDYHSFTYQRERLIPDLDAPKNKETIV